MKVGLRAKEDEVEGHDATSLAPFIFAQGLHPSSLLSSPLSPLIIVQIVHSMELVVFWLLFSSQDWVTISHDSHHVILFLSFRVPYFIGMSCHVQFATSIGGHFSAIPYTGVLLFRAGGGGECGYFNKEEYIQNTGCLLKFSFCLYSNSVPGR